MAKNWQWRVAGLPGNDLFLRHAPEHVKYVTTDPKTAPSLLGRRPEEAERSAALWVYRLSNEKLSSRHGRQRWTYMIIPKMAKKYIFEVIFFFAPRAPGASQTAHPSPKSLCIGIPPAPGPEKLVTKTQKKKTHNPFSHATQKWPKWPKMAKTAKKVPCNAENPENH